jgi:hypothetical protein
MGRIMAMVMLMFARGASVEATRTKPCGVTKGWRAIGGIDIEF